ncbi:DUF1684 domain-containing protein [Flammeovirga agarivorans]|uniref:DUF1684 domain-containing protein n=1 Tax=Flammeovirga agarivorans TaxID=2726742 RepID=A0A7X8XUT1_9BACT|nr:DUF1684 domain-containing protein [Flammeovirga agarivorans]NLR90559.1 DUF1684 domain-containing protein [Flammeovirga agarivorans]
MKPSNIIKIVVALVVVIFLGNSFFSSNSDNGEVKYTERLKNDRDEKNKLFKSKKGSPLSDLDRAKFSHLNYYDINIKYRVMASLKWAEKPKVIKIATTKEKPRDYKKSAFAKFFIDGNEYKVTLLQAVIPNPATKGLFMLLFRDLTSGETTYGAGRYIELHNIKKGQMQTLIDFNEAYNPYCAYNEDYDCPMPPLENQLNVAIEAGEKNYHEL